MGGVVTHTLWSGRGDGGVEETPEQQAWRAKVTFYSYLKGCRNEFVITSCLFLSVSEKLRTTSPLIMCRRKHTRGAWKWCSTQQNISKQTKNLELSSIEANSQLMHADIGACVMRGALCAQCEQMCLVYACCRDFITGFRKRKQQRRADAQK